MEFDRVKLLKMVEDFYLKTLKTKMSDQSKKGFNQILDFVQKDNSWQDIRQLAYFFASIGHESAWYFLPIKEKRARPGQRVYEVQNRYWNTGYYGRGIIQLTHKRNYELFTKLLKIDLVKNPDKALDAEISYKIASFGMQNGSFTGKKLSDYINSKECDYHNARRIVNGTDRAQDIANMAKKFENMLVECYNDAIVVESSDTEFIEVEKVEIEPYPMPDYEANNTLPQVPQITVDVQKELPKETGGGSSWKTTITTILSSLGISGTALGSWLTGYIQDPTTKDMIIFIAVCGIIVAILLVLAWLIIRTVLKVKRERMAHELTIEQMRIQANPQLYNVHVSDDNL